MEDGAGVGLGGDVGAGGGAGGGAGAGDRQVSFQFTKNNIAWFILLAKY